MTAFAQAWELVKMGYAGDEAWDWDAEHPDNEGVYYDEGGRGFTPGSPAWIKRLNRIRMRMGLPDLPPPPIYDTPEDKLIAEEGGPERVYPVEFSGLPTVGDILQGKKAGHDLLTTGEPMAFDRAWEVAKARIPIGPVQSEATSRDRGPSNRSDWNFEPMGMNVSDPIGVKHREMGRGQISDDLGGAMSIGPNIAGVEIDNLIGQVMGVRPKELADADIPAPNEYQEQRIIDETERVGTHEAVHQALRGPLLQYQRDNPEWMEGRTDKQGDPLPWWLMDPEVRATPSNYRRAQEFGAYAADPAGPFESWNRFGQHSKGAFVEGSDDAGRAMEIHDIITDTTDDEDYFDAVRAPIWDRRTRRTGLDGNRMFINRLPEDTQQAVMENIGERARMNAAQQGGYPGGPVSPLHLTSGKKSLGVVNVPSELLENGDNE